MPETESDADHVELTVQRMAELHAQHLESQSPLQRRIAAFTAALAQPRWLVVLTALGGVWILVNTVGVRLGLAAFDPPPFPLLEFIISAAALFTTLMILATQAREEEASRSRSQLTLQLASLSEQKIAKVIGLLEEQRRDNAALPSRPDPEAEEMAKPADPAHVLERIKDTHEGE